MTPRRTAQQRHPHRGDGTPWRLAVIAVAAAVAPADGSRPASPPSPD
jgi:hypothetical protein